MNSFCYLFGFALLCLVFVQNSEAISCYECNSSYDKRCLGDLNNELGDDLKKTCPERKGKPYTLCRKIKQAIDFEVNGLPPDTRVIRTCGWEDTTYANRCYQRSGFGGRQEVCACQGDFCNGSPSTTTSLFVLMLAPVFLTFLLKLHV